MEIISTESPHLSYSSDLSWDYHIVYLLKKVAKQIYCINYLVRAGIPTSDTVCVYYLCSEKNIHFRFLAQLIEK